MLLVSLAVSGISPVLARAQTVSEVVGELRESAIGAIAGGTLNIGEIPRRPTAAGLGQGIQVSGGRGGLIGGPKFELPSPNRAGVLAGLQEAAKVSPESITAPPPGGFGFFGRLEALPGTPEELMKLLNDRGAIKITGKPAVEAFGRGAARAMAPNNPAAQEALFRDFTGQAAREAAREPGASPLNKLGNFLVGVIKFILEIIKWILLTIAGLAGRVADFILSADFFHAFKKGGTLVQFWKFTRDALNFIFILALLAIAFATIAGLEGYGTRLMLPKLLFAALLVNFSLAIGVAFVRLGDILCNASLTTINASAKCGSLGGGGGGAASTLTTKVRDAAALQRLRTAEVNTFMQAVGVETQQQGAGSDAGGGPPSIFGAIPSFDIPTAKTFTEMLGIVVAHAVHAILIGVFTAAIVALAIMFLSRLVVLYLLLVLSPVPYVFSLIPRAAEYGERWWSAFIKYVVFLPVTVFFLVLGVTLMGHGSLDSTIFDELKLGESLTLLTGGVPGDVEDMVKVIFQGLFTSVLMIIALLLGNQLGIYGAKGAIGFGRRAALWAARGGPVGSMLWARTGQPFLAGYKRAQEERAKERARTGLAARVGMFSGAPFAVGQRQRARRRLEDEEVKDLKTRGTPLADLDLGNVAHTRYALQEGLHEAASDAQSSQMIETLARARRVGTPEWGKLRGEVTKSYPHSGTAVMARYEGLDVAGEQKKAVEKLTGRDYAKAVAREREQRGVNLLQNYPIRSGHFTGVYDFGEDKDRAELLRQYQRYTAEARHAAGRRDIRGAPAPGFEGGAGI